MTYKWEVMRINGGFIRPSEEQLPRVLPTMDVLRKCRAGLKKRINKARGDKKVRLTLIKEEIEFLMQSL